MTGIFFVKENNWIQFGVDHTIGLQSSYSLTFDSVPQKGYNEHIQIIKPIYVSPGLFYDIRKYIYIGRV